MDGPDEGEEIILERSCSRAPPVPSPPRSAAWLGCVLVAAVTAGCFRAPASRPPPAPEAGEVESTGAPAAPPGGSAFHFVDVAAAAGLTRIVLGGRPGKDHLLDSAGTGCAFLDYDRDGRLDAYIVNGWRLEGAKVLERGRNALYRGTESGVFEDVTEKAGVAGEGRWGSGVTAADHDGDGWTDLFITNFGPNILYRNRGDGTFENVAARAGIESPGWNTGAAFFDADGDGDLDLYVAAYIDCTLEEVLAAKPTLDWKGVEKVAFGPFGLKGARDHFFRAEPAGMFADATEGAGMEDRALAFGFGVRAADFDGDGDTDVFVANDSDPNYLYRNEGGGVFREVGLWSGCAFDAAGAAQASMGVAVGDATGDGVLDIFVTNFAEDASTLYRGLSQGMFEDATGACGLKEPTYGPLSWGTVLADLDADGDLDLVVLNGHIYPQVDRHPEHGQKYAQKNLLLENREGKFADVTDAAGPGFQLVQASRGLAAGDHDSDGDLDLLITNLDGPPVLLENESRSGAWLTVVCEDERGPMSLIGTQVTVTAGGRKLTRDVAAGDSYMSTHDPRLHFGLGSAKKADRVEVRWPGVARQALEDIPAGQFLKVKAPGVAPGAAPSAAPAPAPR